MKPAIYQSRRIMQQICGLLLYTILQTPENAISAEAEWSIGVYGGQYYDTEPAGFTQGKADYLNQYIIAVTAGKTVWRAEDYPLSLEVDGMIGHQYGLATLDEIAFAPMLNWSGFPWNSILQTYFRFGPLGLSYTTSISPLERGQNGEGSQLLNFLVAELGFSLPKMKEEEIFFRLHHRCSAYDTLNNYGANGEDFFTVGYRHHF